jgi:hypothetical protein
MTNPNRREFLGTGAAMAVPLEAQEAGRRGGPPERRLLVGDLTPERVGAMLIGRDRWQHFPGWSEHEKWQALPKEIQASLLEGGERALKGPWESLPATVFLDFKRNGNRSRYEGIRSGRRNRLHDLVLAELVEGKGRFLDEIVNGVWLTCEETFWGVPAHMSLQRAGTGLPDAEEPVVDLFAAETGAQIAWSWRLLGEALDKVSPLVRRRMLIEVQRRILEPCWTRNDFWWMGLAPNGREALNNWTPWIDSNWLTCTLLMEENETRRGATVHKIMRSVDRFLDSYHDDGGCDEGPSYWGRAGASLFDCLELLRSATGGKLDYYGLPLVKEIGRYIYRAHIDKDWYVNFADAPARVGISSDLVFRYGRRIGDEKMAGLGLYAASLRRGGRFGGDSIGRDLASAFDTAEFHKASGTAPYVRDVWLPGTQVFAARKQEGSPAGFYVAAQGGHNAESHNHNDVGNFVVYLDGNPVLVDVGVETYTAKTFSSQRYDIWTMQSAYHNLPTVNGTMQAAGRQYEAQNVAAQADDKAAEFALDIEKAYPPAAGITKWRRTIRMDRGANSVEVKDDYRLSKAERIEFSLMTPAALEGTPAGGVMKLKGGVKISYDASAGVVVEEIKIDDARLRGSWGTLMRRIRLIMAQPKAEGTFLLKVEKA